MAILEQLELNDRGRLGRITRAVYLLASDRVPGDFRAGGRGRASGGAPLWHLLRECDDPRGMPWIAQRAPWRFAFVLALGPECGLDELYVLEMRAHRVCKRVATRIHGSHRQEPLGYTGELKPFVAALAYEFQEFARPRTLQGH